MTDQIDTANDLAELFRDKAMASRPKVQPLPPTGECYWCSNPVKDDLRWCPGRECRDAFEADVAAEKRRMVAAGRMGA